MILGWLLSITGILITLMFVIGTHEAGHFLVARLVGVKVARFSIGFGKRLFSWTDKSGTEYIFALIPLGGYVQMQDEAAYQREPFYKKFLIVMAGPAINFIGAFILYWIIFVVGFTTIRPIIGDVTPHSLAAEAGLKPQQEIVEINQQTVSSWTGILFRLLINMGNEKPINITVKNTVTQQTKSHLIDLSQFKIDELKPDPLSNLGITPYSPKPPLNTWPKDKLKDIQYGVVTAIPHAASQVFDLTYFNAILFGKMLTGKLSLKSLGGPITIFSTAGNAFHAGFMSFISFLAFLSIAIGFINLLPIPGLDGGHLLIQTIEFVIRKPLSTHIQFLLFRLGFIIIFLIFIQALINDVLRLW